MTLALEMRGITKRFPGVVANDHVDFQLEQGEIHALLGENGAGKTTLRHILHGLARPDEGEIVVQGCSIPHMIHGIASACERCKGRTSMKLRTGDPWMPAPDYGRSLRGLTINLLVRDIAAALPFHREVLGAEVVYSDPDFAVLRSGEAEWMLHADHTYLAHPLHPSLAEAWPRGVGAELRLHGRDPDAAEAAARRLGCTVLAATTDKPHGLREAYLLDADGYLWVPDVLRPR